MRSYPRLGLPLPHLPITRHAVNVSRRCRSLLRAIVLVLPPLTTCLDRRTRADKLVLPLIASSRPRAASRSPSGSTRTRTRSSPVSRKLSRSPASAETPRTGARTFTGSPSWCNLDDDGELTRARADPCSPHVHRMGAWLKDELVKLGAECVNRPSIRSVAPHGPADIAAILAR